MARLNIKGRATTVLARASTRQTAGVSAGHRGPFREKAESTMLLVMSISE